MPRREPLNREKILDAALALTDEHGLDGLSMRRLAKSLGVEAMSLYNHVSNKADILDGIADRVYRSIPIPDSALAWPDRIRMMALEMFRALSRHPVVPLALVTDQANPASIEGLQPLEQLLAALHEAGFHGTRARRAVGVINATVFGSLLLTTDGFTGPIGANRQLPPSQYRDRIDPDRLPRFAALLEDLPSTDPEADFRQMIDTVVAGLIAQADTRAEAG